MGEKKDLTAIVDTSGYFEELFDLIPNVVFFVKDLQGRYRIVNTTLVERCGLDAKSELLGRTALEVFPPPLGERYLGQDRSVARSATPIAQKLELHLYPSGLEGWCLTDKIPLVGSDGRVVGVAGISRDLQTPAPHGEGYERLARAMDLIQSDPANPLTAAEIARRVEFSAYQLNRRLKNLLGITVRQLLTKTRIDAASRLLRSTTLAVGDIAQRSGYCDQSAFTRQFRRTTGLTPLQYRRRHHDP
jgi:AraC-like DNA-binding protein